MRECICCSSDDSLYLSFFFDFTFSFCSATLTNASVHIRTHIHILSSNNDATRLHSLQSYMEDHLKNKDRLNREWEGLLSYEADPSSTAAALLPANRGRNRYIDILPYDHSRVILNDLSNCSKSDYINANTIVSLTYSHICFSPRYVLLLLLLLCVARRYSL